MHPLPEHGIYGAVNCHITLFTLQAAHEEELTGLRAQLANAAAKVGELKLASTSFWQSPLILCCKLKV